MNPTLSEEASALDSESMESIPYRSLSGLAVAAFILGCLSPLALVHVVLWLLPPVALVMAWLARRQVRSSDAGGERLIRVAIAIAILSGVWAVTQALAGDYAHKIKARQFADAWAKLVERGELRQAHQWSLSPGSRVRDVSLVDAYYEGNDEGQATLKKFLAKGSMPRLSTLNPGETIRFKRWDEWLSSENQRLGKLRYELVGPSQEKPPLEFVISVSRVVETESRKSRWQVVSVE